MRGYMFRNRWGALLFVGLTLAGVTKLVGTEEDDGALLEARDQLAQQQTSAERFLGSGPATARASDVPVEFTADEELIDGAEGEDPTPLEQFEDPADPASAPEAEVFIVEPEPAPEG